MYKEVNIANTQFVGYTKPRLEKRLAIYTDIISDVDALDYEIEEAARLRREVKACLNVFVEFDVDDASATVADIIEVVTGKPIEFHQKHTMGGALGADIVDRTAKASRATAVATKKTLNVFGNWLASKTR
jgi:hypothetical protein